MKDYLRDIEEILRRKREFNENFSLSYDDNNITMLWPDPESPASVDECCLADFIEIISDLTEHPSEQTRLRVMCANTRLLSLATYVLRYSAIEKFLSHTSEGDLLPFVLNASDSSVLSAEELYDILLNILPSYAEAILSKIDASGVNVIEDIIEAFLKKDKQTFCQMVKSAKGDIGDVLSICKYVKDNSLRNLERKIISLSMQYSANKAICDNIEWSPDSRDGRFMLDIQSLSKLREEIDKGNVEAEDNLEAEFNNQTYIAYCTGMRIFLDFKDLLNNEQEEQYQQLLRAPELDKWYEPALKECHRWMKEEEQLALKDTKEFSLPEDFFDYHIDYEIPELPTFIASQLRYAAKQFETIVNLLVQYRCIEDSNKAKYEFIRAFTRRTPIEYTNIKFTKAKWIGPISKLIFLVKRFTEGGQNKYRAILDLFELREEDEKWLRTQLETDVTKISQKGVLGARDSFADVIKNAFTTDKDRNDEEKTNRRNERNTRTQL